MSQRWITTTKLIAGYLGKLVPISAYNYFFMIEIIRTVRSIIPATHLQKIGISVPPYVFILKEYVAGILFTFSSPICHL